MHVYDCVCVCCSGSKGRDGELHYLPFRMTPYLMKVQDAELAEEQFCCLLLAERVHSGYEGEACRLLHMLSVTLVLHSFEHIASLNKKILHKAFG